MAKRVSTAFIRTRFRHPPEIHKVPHPHNLSSHRWWKKGKRPARDSFRQRCYKAEDNFRAGAPSDHFKTASETARYVQSVMETKWFQRRWPHFTSCEIIHSSRIHGGYASARTFANSNAGGTMFVKSGRITLSTWAMVDVIVLHELAHAIIPRGHQHDRRWIRTYLDLVKFKMGKLLADDLRAEFKAQKLKWNPVRQVEGNPEIYKHAPCHQ